MPVSRTPAKKQNILTRDLAFGPVRAEEKVTFAKHLSVMLQAGLSVVEALEVAQDAASGKMRRVLDRVRMATEAGNSLSEALSEYPRIFSPLFRSAIRAGEQSGTLVENLTYVAEQLDKEKKVLSRVRSALTYPAVILIASFFLALGMAYYILPQIIPLFTGLKIDLPWTTRAVIWFAELMRTQGTHIFLGTIFGAVGLIWLLRQRYMQPLTHGILLHIPVLNVVIKKSSLMRTCMTLGTLLKSGLPIEEAIEITAGAMNNLYYRKALLRVATDITHGANLAELLKDDPELFPKLVVSMVHVGESSGSLGDSLLYLSAFYEAEVETATKTLTTTIEPLLLLLIGLIVGVLGLAIITPIYQVTGNIAA